MAKIVSRQSLTIPWIILARPSRIIQLFHSWRSFNHCLHYNHCCTEDDRNRQELTNFKTTEKGATNKRMVGLSIEKDLSLFLHLQLKWNLILWQTVFVVLKYSPKTPTDNTILLDNWISIKSSFFLVAMPPSLVLPLLWFNWKIWNPYNVSLCSISICR